MQHDPFVSQPSLNAVFWIDSTNSEQPLRASLSCRISTMAASQSTCASGFRSVFNIFMTEVNFGQVEVVSLQSTSFLDLQITLSQIQSRQKATRKTMYLRRLSPFLEALQQFETVTNLFLNPAEYIACIWVCCSSRFKKCRGPIVYICTDN